MPLRLLGRAARRKELFESDAKVAAVVEEASSVATELEDAVNKLNTWWIDRKAHGHG